MSHGADEKHQANPKVLVGIILGTKGVYGELKIQPHTDNLDRFLPGSKLLLLDELVEIEHSRFERGNYIVKINNIDTLEQARDLQGDILEIHSEYLSSTSTDVYYYYHILDMDVWTRDGEYLGKISEIISTGSNDVYVVSGEGRDILIPALSEVVLDVDVDVRKMVVNLQEFF